MSQERITKVIAILVIGIIVVIANKLRAGKMSDFSKKLGFEELKDVSAYISTILNFEVFKLTSKVNIILTKVIDNNTKIYIIDHQYHSVATQTLFLLESTELNLPDFTLKPKTLLKSSTIELDAFPKFSSKYILEGEEKEKIINSVFDSKLVDFLLERKKILIEVKDNKIMMYKKQIKVKTEKLPIHVDEIVELFNLLKK